MKKILSGLIVAFVVVAFTPSEKSDLVVNQQTSLIDIQELLGMDFSQKKVRSDVKGVSAIVGEDIVKKGTSKRDGQKKSKRQSKHFVCTSCHNIVPEDPNQAFFTPEARLIYTAEKGIPFLQATTLYGAVNRESYYNGDYEKKYGDLVDAARNDIRGAIQLCATECWLCAR